MKVLNRDEMKNLKGGTVASDLCDFNECVLVPDSCGRGFTCITVPCSISESRTVCALSVPFEETM